MTNGEKKAHIVIVEDDTTIAMGLKVSFEHEQFGVQCFERAEDAISYLRDNSCDLVICDIMLPQMDGIAAMQILKREHPDIPVILLTAKGTEIDRVMGLEMGADDYVTKPFSTREVLARVKARLRQHTAEAEPMIVYFGDVKVDLRRHRLWKNGEEVKLTTHEAGTLSYLMRHQGKDVNRDDLLRHVWGYTIALTTRTVDNQILKLRKKIEDDPGQPRHILTVHGTGYRFEL